MPVRQKFINQAAARRSKPMNYLIEAEQKDLC